MHRSAWGRRSDRPARKTYKTYRNQDRRKTSRPRTDESIPVDHRCYANLDRSPSTPRQRRRRTADRSRVCGRTCDPLVPVQDRSARPKPNRQCRTALQQRKRRLRENPDWVKLEPAANREPPRHQRQSSTEVPNPRNHRIDSRAECPPKRRVRNPPRRTAKTSRTAHVRRRTILVASSKLLAEGTNTNGVVAKSESPEPPKWPSRAAEAARHSEYHNVPHD